MSDSPSEFFLDGRDVAFSDDELTEMAMGADPRAPIDPDAVPWRFGWGFETTLLPDWYMPRPIAVGRGRATRTVVASVVAGMIIVCAFGLCVTSGFLQWA